MRLAFDMASFCWTGLNAGEDKENGRKILHEEKLIQVNSAIHGYERAMNSMISAMKQVGVTPSRCILVFEGMHSKRRRQMIDNTYKADRDSRPPEAYEEYQKLQVMLQKAWLDVGAIAMRQDAVEGDDVLAYLALHSEDDITLATHDHDLMNVHGENPQGKRVDVLIDGKVGVHRFGAFPNRFVTLRKTLVGGKDGMKGCPRFGEKTWEAFYQMYGDQGMDYLLGLLNAGSLGPLHAQAEEDKAIALICNNEAEVLKSFKLASLHPEWVNTRNMRLQITPGMCKGPVEDERLLPWAPRVMLLTAENFEQEAAWCRREFQRSPFIALDIETSTPPESDEWLENQVPPNPDGVDVLGSTLTGLSLTFGDNLQYTVYISVDHANTANVSSEQVRQLVAAVPCELVIQNLSFELVVLYNEWAEKQLDNGYDGFLPRCLDTKMEASYVNENIKNGLKLRSLEHLGYKQQTFAETTQFTGFDDELPPGGRLIKELEPATYYDGQDTQISEERAMELDAAGETAIYMPARVTRQYKMNQLSAAHVFGYGCDDTICTAALHNYYRLVMELEHTWQCYLETEIDAAYMSAVGFLQGTDFSAAKMRELAAEDDKTYEAAWATLRGYLLSKGWDGSVCPEFGVSSKPADFKVAFEIVTGRKLDTGVRLPEKLAKLIEAEGEPTLAALLMGAYKVPTHAEDGSMMGPWRAFNEYVKRHFKGEPQFNSGSPTQKARLMYEVMRLPVVMRNAPTDQMKAAGIREGSAKTDVLAIDWALKFDASEADKPALEALKLMQMVETRRTLYYNKYPGFLHWKTGKLHSSLNQCEANTRRSSESGPNKQQLPKHQKIEGQPARYRETIVPHHAQAVIVSLDESSQELRIIADYSQDPAMVACYVGDNKKDMHSLTGLGIAKRKHPKVEWSYEVFEAARANPEDILHKIAKECRVLGKKVNFTTEYGAMAPKVAETLLIQLDESEAFVEAKEEAFPVASAWKDTVINEARDNGYVRTKGGAVRHLQDALNSNDRYTASKAERQAVNFEVQGSAAEQTKRAYGAAWKRRLAFKYDCVFIGPIHDEVVWSVAICDLLPFLREMHECMTQPYGGMTIPIESSISFGPSFGEQVEAGESPELEDLEGALGTLAGKYPQYAAEVQQAIAKAKASSAHAATATA
jgi:DNA polymerase I-like protein with 3'-5' exonuclease and polymerase domains